MFNVKRVWLKVAKEQDHIGLGLCNVNRSTASNIPLKWWMFLEDDGLMSAQLRVPNDYVRSSDHDSPYTYVR